MTRLDAVIVSAFDAMAQEYSDDADEFEGAKHRCREVLAALGVSDDDIEAAMTSTRCTAAEGNSV